MNARSYRPICALAACAMLADAQEAAFQLYSRREIASQVRPFGEDPEPLVKLLDSPLGKKYLNINPKRSILLWDCQSTSLWCGSPDFAFPQTLSFAARGLGLGSADALVYSWYLSAIRDNYFKLKMDPWAGRPLSEAPFHLLAIVNRMDLASWKDKKWKDAELRFVYGRKPQDQTVSTPPELTLIVEFVLPPFDWSRFQKFAGYWEKLGSVDDSTFLAAMHDVLKASGVEHPLKLRIRTNVGNAGPWRFSEWDLTKASSVTAGQPLAFSPLENQILESFVYAPPGSDDYKSYLKLWPDIAALPGAKQVEISNSFLEPDSLTYGSLDKVFPTPQRFCATDATRRALALERCTGCHYKESNTGFTHIQNRMEGESSQLSGFLLGSAPDIDLRDVYYASTGKIFEVTFTYPTYIRSTGTVCDQPFDQPITRRFYDIGRRRLFLAAVLIAPPSFSDSARALIEEFRTDYSH